MPGWQKVIGLAAAILVVACPLSSDAMSSHNQDKSPDYRVEYRMPEGTKLKSGEEVLDEQNQDVFLVATIKVSEAGYIPAGVEVRARISPLIFTANIPPEVLPQLEQDPIVLAIEPAQNLRSY